MINLKIIRDAGFAGKATPPDAGSPINRGKGKGGGIGGGKKGSADPNSALLTNLNSYWKLDETGTITSWADEQGNAPLGNVTGVSIGTAVQGTAADWYSATGGFGWIDPATTGLDTTTEDFSMCCWLYPKVLSTSTWSVCMYRGLNNSSGASTRDFVLGRFGVSATPFYINTYNGSNSVNANSTVNDATNQWFFLAAYYKHSTFEIAISVNGETWVTNNMAGAINTNQERFKLARGPSSGISNNWYVRGYMDEAAFWNGRILTQDEITWLYNSGTGRAYSELT